AHAKTGRHQRCEHQTRSQANLRARQPSTSDGTAYFPPFSSSVLITEPPVRSELSRDGAPRKGRRPESLPRLSSVEALKATRLSFSAVPPAFADRPFESVRAFRGLFH